LLETPTAAASVAPQSWTEQWGRIVARFSFETYDLFLSG